MSTNSQKGFAPIVIILAVVALLVVGVGGFILVSRNKTPSLPPPPLSQTETTPVPSPSNQTLKKIETLPPASANPKELLGWWEEDSELPFYIREFTDQYFCIQRSSRSTCVANTRYRAEGNKILLDKSLLEGWSDFYFYATWKMVGNKLELTTADSPGPTLYKKIGPPTSSGKITLPP